MHYNTTRLTKITCPPMPSAKIKLIFNINQIFIIGQAFKEGVSRRKKITKITGFQFCSILSIPSFLSFFFLFVPHSFNRIKLRSAPRRKHSKNQANSPCYQKTDNYPGNWNNKIPSKTAITCNESY